MATISADVVRAALAAMKPRPSLEMYPGDWLRDPIAGCSLAANGFWWRAMMVMHDAKPYGHLVGANGAPLSETEVIRRCGCDSRNELRKVQAEIARAGIPGRTGDADYHNILTGTIEIQGEIRDIDLSPLAIEEKDVIYSRRMLRDRRLSLIRFLVSTNGQRLLSGLTIQTESQKSKFDRVRAHDQKEDEEESLASSPEESSSPDRTSPRPSSPDFEAVARLVPRFEQVGIRVLPPHQVIVGWVQDFGEELVLDVLAKRASDLRGKHYAYLQPILMGRKENRDTKSARHGAKRTAKDFGMRSIDDVLADKRNV